uniref:Reverse transcriptase Ty1/copia-type domain-containing protein n=1 Tax=Vitis vinifera TaxID=29760 RepID=A5ANW7_VITVI|nr:hypothetical protein VITISV_040712 [Vitis vinifera]
MDENGIIFRNKARLVAQGFNQEKWIDYEETFAPVARLEAIRMLLVFRCFKDFILYQIDVKCAFLNGFINEEVYVEQPPGFQSFNFPNHVFKLKKTLYGLKQAPRAWYERFSKFLLENGFKMGKIDTTLFIKTKENDMFLVQYMLISFLVLLMSLWEEFYKCMHNEFEMSMMGKLNFILRLQIKQLKEGTFINQAKYIRDFLKTFNMEEAKTTKTPMSSSIKLDKDKKGFQVRAFTSSSSSSCFVSIFYGSQMRACSLQDTEQVPRATYYMGGLITSIVRRVEICLDPDSIYRIFDIGPIGLRVYESKMWLIVLGFEPRKAIQRIYGLLDAHEMGKPSTHRVFKDVGIDLSRETDFEVLNTYNTYDDQSMERMKFEKALDETLSQTKGVQFETTFFEPMMIELTFIEGPSTQLSYTELSFSGPAFTKPTHTNIPPPQAPPAPDHAPWMDLSAQISSLGTCMEELVVVSDTRFYSTEDRMDQY